MKEEEAGICLPQGLHSSSPPTPLLGSQRVSQCSPPIPSPFFWGSLGLAESPLESRSRKAGCRTGRRSAGEGFLACLPPVPLIPKPLTMEVGKRVGPDPAKPPQRVFTHQTSPSDKPRRVLHVLVSSCCRKQEKLGVRRWAKPGRFVPEEEGATSAASTCSGPGVSWGHC